MSGNAAGRAACATDCRSEVGITVGLIDALISIARVLAGRDFRQRDAHEALRDLAHDEDVAAVFDAARRADAFGPLASGRRQRDEIKTCH